MSFFENVFGKIHNWVRDSETSRKRIYAIEFEELYPSLVAVAQGCLEPDSTSLQLKSYDGFGCLYGYTLLLPREYVPFQDIALNRDLFLHKALMGGVLRRLGYFSKARQGSALEQALEIFCLRNKMEDTAAEIFPEYRSWADSLHEYHRRALKDCDLPTSDAAWLRIEATLKDQTDGVDLKTLVARLRADLIREIDQLPTLALAPWCMPILQQTLLDSGESADLESKRERSENSEEEGSSPGEIEVVDLEKERKQENPITHSFEKLETADEYQGGFKTADGTDQLEQQKNAIDELDLKKVTRGGEAANSTYRADIAELIRTKGAAEKNAKSIEHLFYPEWDYETRTLKPKYCRLYVEKPEVPPEANGDQWLKELKESHATSLEEWKHRLAMLVNQRRWRDRQWDGNEVSIDAFIRYWTDFKHSGFGDPRLYSKTFPAVRDFSCLVLLDQSYSTDSWVMNRRVLDIERDSLGLLSELLGPLREPVAIAGTWSETRNHCHFRLYKDFNDPWNQWLSLAPGLVSQGYTRLGPSIRHATKLLSEQGGKHKLLILLTDGKPTDYDRYEGRYGIEDIHHACLEATQKGIQLRALAVEKEAKNYFPHLFGAGNYQVLQHPDELPERLFKIYMDTIR